MDYRAEYEKWLRDFADDRETLAALQAIAGDEKEIEDRFYTLLSFGTAGMRGVLGPGLNRMNVYNVRRATGALADYIAQTGPQAAARGVAIAYDSRRCSAEFACEAALVLCARGVRAYLFESLRPVPVLSFTVRHLGCIAGIVITASHNPPQYNGYKVYWEDGGQMPPERAGEVQRRFAQADYAHSLPMPQAEALEKGLLHYIGAQVDDAYTAAVESLCVNPDLAREMGDTIKIVYTPLHGSGNLPVRRVLKDLGFTQVYVVPEQELPDPDFSTVRVPNPEDPAAFTLALALRRQLGADVVFGTDPDCDRVGVAALDGQGEAHILSGNQIGCLLLDYVLSQRAERGDLPANAAAVKSIVSTEMARAICDHYGVALFDVLTGFKFIAEKIQQFEESGSHRFVFGFEESYGYLSGRDVRDKDGVNASMLIAETAAYYKKRGMTLYQAMRALYQKYGFYAEKVISHTLTGKDGLEKMRAIMQGLRKNPPEAIAGLRVTAVRDYLHGYEDLPPSDVLYYQLERGAWVCIRPSGTEPKIKLYVNVVSRDEDESLRLLDACTQDALRLMEPR